MIVHTGFKYTSTGPIAKINGVWYSVNGTAQDIIDVRYPLTAIELELNNVTND